MRVNVDEQAISEPRIRRMARRLSKQHERVIHHTEVLGRLISVWMLCYSRRSPILRDDDVDIAADLDHFAEAMVAEEMAEPTDADMLIHVCGVSERIAFLERQSERGKRGGRSPRETMQTRLFAEDEALAKRVLVRTGANAVAAVKRAAERTSSERLSLPQAYSPDLDQDQAQDLDQDRVPRDRGIDATGPTPQRPNEGEEGSGLPQDERSAVERGKDAADLEKRATGKPAREVPDQALTLSHLLLAQIIANHPTGRIAKAPERVRDATALRWAETVDKLNRIDKFSWGEIEGMITWSQRDAFWRGVILGADNLRDKWDKMAAQRNRPRGSAAARDTPSAFDVLDEHAQTLNRQEKKTG